MNRAVNQEAFENVIRDNLSPEGVAATVVFLRLASSYRPPTAASRPALQQVVWLADALLDLLGVDEYNRLIEELGL